MRLFVIEDEQSLRRTSQKKLQRSGYEVDACGDGETASEYLSVEYYDLILLDLNLPKIDGMTLLRSFRKENQETPVLILSARSEIADKVEGLDAGANDYLSKPFHLAELEARIRSLTRRQFIQRDVRLQCGQIVYDTKSRTATADGVVINLTRKETGVLEYLMLHQGRPSVRRNSLNMYGTAAWTVSAIRFVSTFLHSGKNSVQFLAMTPFGIVSERVMK